MLGNYKCTKTRFLRKENKKYLTHFIEHSAMAALQTTTAANQLWVAVMYAESESLLHENDQCVVTG